jgi:2-polyprenyl-6-methoxyphenol hydroxylase-like FAD-dependent oxidoreductase
VALIGDAASANDPCWGQGLSLTLRDARVLRNHLLASDDWDAAAHAYAAEHDGYYGVVREVTHALKDLFLRSGADADARRARALPLVAKDRTRLPDHPFSGPDLPWSAQVRGRLFGES